MFLRRIQSSLTAISNHYIDWTRVGELLQSGTHRYSKEELVPRGMIIGTIATSAFLGSHFNNVKYTRCSSLVVAIAAGVLGFVVSHYLVIRPLINKRKEISAACTKLKNDIEAYATTNNLPFRDALDKTIQKIMRLSLTDEQAGRASQTWGKRLRLLKNLFETLQSNVTDDFWKQETSDIIDALENKEQYNGPSHYKKRNY